jgi:hypothetical protein
MKSRYYILEVETPGRVYVWSSAIVNQECLEIMASGSIESVTGASAIEIRKLCKGADRNLVSVKRERREKARADAAGSNPIGPGVRGLDEPEVKAGPDSPQTE